MSRTNNGGPAFPTDAQSQLEQDHYEGMTLRDYFAAATIQAIISNYADWRHSSDYISTLAYKQADAMLRERERI